MSPAAPAARATIAGDVMNGNGTTFDGTLHYKLASTIVLALVIVFGLQLAGFRFVGAVNVGLGGK
jgi:hypothetical protein